MADWIKAVIEAAEALRAKLPSSAVPTEFYDLVLQRRVVRALLDERQCLYENLGSIEARTAETLTDIYKAHEIKEANAKREGWDTAILAAAKEVESLLERGRTIRETAAAIRALRPPVEATTPRSDPQ